MYLVAFIVLGLSVFWVDIVECYEKPDLRDDLNTNWYNSYDFDGDKKADKVHVHFSGGAHCCYRIGIFLMNKLPRVHGHSAKLAREDRAKAAPFQFR